jgi:hypothetical protein
VCACIIILRSAVTFWGYRLFLDLFNDASAIAEWLSIMEMRRAWKQLLWNQEHCCFSLHSGWVTYSSFILGEYQEFESRLGEVLRGFLSSPRYLLIQFQKYAKTVYIQKFVHMLQTWANNSARERLVTVGAEVLATSCWKHLSQVSVLNSSSSRAVESIVWVTWTFCLWFRI